MLSLFQSVARINQFDPKVFSGASVGVEIQDFSAPTLLDTDWQERLNQYKRALANTTTQVALHGACVDLNPASADSRIRKVTRERYIHSLEIAHRLEAAYIVFHSQVNPYVRGERLRLRRIQRQKPLWEELADRAHWRDVQIVIENVHESHYGDLVRLVETVGLPTMKICLDIGHLKVHSSLPIGDWIRACAPHLAFVHLNDNDGRRDQHLPPTEETLLSLFESLDQNGLEPAIALEYEPKLGLREEVERIRTVEAAVAGYPKPS